jgi:hypothetical protein
MEIVYAEPEPPYKVNISAAWMPVLKIYGEAPDWNTSIFAAGSRFSMIYSFSAFYIGPELTTTFYYYPGIEEDLLGLMFSGEFCLLFGKQMLNNRMAHHLRLGGGYTILLSAEEISSAVCVNMGTSLFLRPAKHFFLEVGIDYIHYFNYEHSGLMRPWVGAGVQF